MEKTIEDQLKKSVCKCFDKLLKTARGADRRLIESARDSALKERICVEDVAGALAWGFIKTSKRRFVR